MHFNYSDHPEVFTECYVISIAKDEAFKKNSKFKKAILDMSLNDNLEKILTAEQIKLYRNEEDISEKKLTALNRLIVNTGKTKLDEKNKQVQKLRVLDNGYCKYTKNDFKPCVLRRGFHEGCPFFIPNKKGIEDIGEKLTLIDNDISAELKTIDLILNETKKLVNTDSNFRTSVNKIKALVRTKASICAEQVFLK